MQAFPRQLQLAAAERLHRLLQGVALLDESRVLGDLVVGGLGVDQTDLSLAHRLALGLEGLQLRVVLVKGQQSHDVQQLGPQRGLLGILWLQLLGRQPFPLLHVQPAHFLLDRAPDGLLLAAGERAVGQRVGFEGLPEGVDVGLVLGGGLAVREGEFLEGLRLAVVLEGLVLLLFGGGGEGHAGDLLDEALELLYFLVFGLDGGAEGLEVGEDEGLGPAEGAVGPLVVGEVVGAGLVGVVAEGVVAVEGEVVVAGKHAIRQLQIKINASWPGLINWAAAAGISRQVAI